MAAEDYHDDFYYPPEADDSAINWDDYYADMNGELRLTKEGLIKRTNKQIGQKIREAAKLKEKERFMKNVKNGKRTMTRRFYIGSSQLTAAIESDGGSDYVGLLAEKISEAKQMILDETRTVVYIVEIVKVVRAKKVEQPIIVEDVV